MKKTVEGAKKSSIQSRYLKPTIRYSHESVVWVEGRSLQVVKYVDDETKNKKTQTQTHRMIDRLKE